MRPTPILVLEKVGDRWTFDYYKPESVLPSVTTRAALVRTLALHPIPVTPDSQRARRLHVERVRPALRWFCRAFQVRVPSWLASDNCFLELPRAEHDAMFGPAPLSIREFVPWRKRA